MWPNKSVQNYIGLKVITVKVISNESLIKKLREVFFGLTQESYRPVLMIYSPTTGWRINHKDRSIRSLCKAKSRQLLFSFSIRLSTETTFPVIASRPM